MPNASSRPSKRVVDGAMTIGRDGPKYFSISSLTDEGFIRGSFSRKTRCCHPERRGCPVGLQHPRLASQASLLRFSACLDPTPWPTLHLVDAQAQPVLPASARLSFRPLSVSQCDLAGSTGLASVPCGRSLCCRWQTPIKSGHPLGDSPKEYKQPR